MIDNTKFLTDNQTIIERMQMHPDFVVCKPKNNYYHSLKHSVYGIKLSLDFRKAVENGSVIGYGHLEINISPHYHFNQYQHNGNDFTPYDCINSLNDIFEYLGIKKDEFESLRVVNLEFGLNIIPDTDIKNLINGLFFYKKTPFKIGEFPYFRITDATSYKKIKAYAKGLQFLDYPQYGIHPNTFRFEVKTKQFKNVATYGINISTDLLNLETYNRLGQSLLNEWDFILCSNKEPDLSNSNTDEVSFIEQGKNVEFWSKLISEKHRNTFQLNKEKYYKMLGRKNNLHQQIKTKIVDKIFIYSKCANSTQRTPINREKLQNEINTSTLINLEYAHFTQCLVTGLDISMQKKGSKFLCVKGLKYYKENQPETYQKLTEKYLTEKQKGKSFDRQNYFIAHNIRNAKTNPTHNPKYSRERFEQRNYNKQQLQFNF
ncbi:hypothetical protein [Chryseobacterium sp. T1]